MKVIKILAILLSILILTLIFMSKETNLKGDCPEIIIRPDMTDYKLYVPFVLGWEGGHANDKDDKGGETWKGITFDTYKGLCLKVYGCKPSKQHFLSLSDESVGLMIKYFWDYSTSNNRIKSQKVSEAITSWAWGSGMLTGCIWFQQMLNSEYNAGLQVDGKIGILAVNFINSLDPDELFRKAVAYRRNRFLIIIQRDPTQRKWLQGWLNRLRKFAQRHGELDYFNSINV